MKTQRDNLLSLYDDLTLVLIIQCLYCCTDLVNNDDSRYAVGYLINVLTLQNIIVNLLFIFLMPLRKLRLILKWLFAVRA